MRGEFEDASHRDLPDEPATQNLVANACKVRGSDPEGTSCFDLDGATAAPGERLEKAGEIGFKLRRVDHKEVDFTAC